MDKRIKNSSGDIVIRDTDSCGIVEIMHMWDRNRDCGCVIGYFEKRKCDGRYEAEFKSVGDRIISVEYDDPQILVDAIKCGFKLAEVVIEFGDWDE